MVSNIKCANSVLNAIISFSISVTTQDFIAQTAVPPGKECAKTELNLKIKTMKAMSAN